MISRYDCEKLMDDLLLKDKKKESPAPTYSVPEPQDEPHHALVITNRGYEGLVHHARIKKDGTLLY